MRSTFLPLSLSLSLSLSYFYFNISRSSNRRNSRNGSDSAFPDWTAISWSINFAWGSHESRDRKREENALKRLRHFFHARALRIVWKVWVCWHNLLAQRERLNSIVFAPTIIAIFLHFSTVRGLKRVRPVPRFPGKVTHKLPTFILWQFLRLFFFAGKYSRYEMACQVTRQLITYNQGILRS